MERFKLKVHWGEDKDIIPRDELVDQIRRQTKTEDSLVMSTVLAVDHTRFAVPGPVFVRWYKSTG